MLLDSRIRDSAGKEVSYMAPINCQLAVYNGDFPDDPNSDLKDWKWFTECPYTVPFGGEGWNVGLSCKDYTGVYAYIVKGTTTLDTE